MNRGQTIISNPVYESPVFLENIHAKESVVVNQGGTWSGKTFSIIQVLFYLTLTTTYRDKEGRLEPIVTTIVGQDVPNLKKGAITDFQNVADIIVNSFPRDCRHFFSFTYNKTDKVCLFSNGAKIEFSSFKDWQDAKSGKRHFVFLNEGNGIPYKIAEQLMFRAKIRTFIDYNPDAPFWVHHKLIGKPDVKVIYSNLSHNKFVPDKVRRELIAKGKQNPEFQKVYILGKTGQTQGVVFPSVNWVSSMPETYKKEAYGMDFGFTNDPTTLVRIVESEGLLYAELLIHETGLTSDDIVTRLKDVNFSLNVNLYADAASPKTISELKRKGIRRVRGAKKGAGSILGGIDLIKSFGTPNLVDNIHWRAEQIGYQWLEDKLTGDMTNKPKDSFNHIWDAMRYGMQGITKKQRKGVKLR